MVAALSGSTQLAKKLVAKHCEASPEMEVSADNQAEEQSPELSDNEVEHTTPTCENVNSLPELDSPASPEQSTSDDLEQQNEKMVTDEEFDQLVKANEL